MLQGNKRWNVRKGNNIFCLQKITILNLSGLLAFIPINCHSWHFILFCHYSNVVGIAYFSTFVHGFLQLHRRLFDFGVIFHTNEFSVMELLSLILSLGMISHSLSERSSYNLCFTFFGHLKIYCLSQAKKFFKLYGLVFISCVNVKLV